MRVPGTSRCGQKIAKKYVLAMDATDVLHTTCHAQRAHIALGYRENRWHRWPTLPKKDPEARRIATELVKLQKDDAITARMTPTRGDNVKKPASTTPDTSARIAFSGRPVRWCRTKSGYEQIHIQRHLERGEGKAEAKIRGAHRR